ncbi:ComF family protein [Haloplasma contractile]|nr:phosphoribosyltransferase family protein [Haloplasma contractile]
MQLNCLFCNKHMNQRIRWVNLFSIKQDVICVNCKSKLERINGGCIRCNKKTDQDICPDCKYWIHHPKTRDIPLQNKSLYHYNDLAKLIMERVKFKGDCKLLDAFKRDVNEFFEMNFSPLNYVIIPTPITEERLYERGFNQAAYLIRDLPYEQQNIFIKISNEKQSKKDKWERLTLKKQFSIDNTIKLSDKKVILVDDLYTTGSTIHNMARELMSNGYQKEICSFTLFRG